MTRVRELPSLAQTAPKSGKVDVPSPDLYTYERIAPGVERLEDVGEKEIKSFHAQGYLVIRSLFTSSQVDDARRAIRDLISGRQKEFRGVQFEPAVRGKQDALSPEERLLAVRKLHGFVGYDLRLGDMAGDPDLLSLLERLMGAEPVLFQDMALLKPPHVGSEKPWHQDCAYFNLPLGTTVIGAWIALDAATCENGCLHIMPASHLQDPMPHFKRRDWQICDADVRIGADLVVPLEPGGCLLWHGLTQHGSPANRSNQARRALQFHYKPAGTGNITVEERMEVFGGEVRGAEC
jgi:phytanoyl-CoA hydroxylase